MDDNWFNLTHPSNLVLSITTGITGSLGLPGNICLILIILTDYTKRKPHEWLIFAMTVSDFLFCLANVALESPFIIDFTRIECIVAGPIEYFFGFMSICVPSLIAYNRYLSLYDNQKYQRLFTNRNVLIMYSPSLILSILWVLPFILTGNLGQDYVGLCGVIIRGKMVISVVIAATIASISHTFLVFFSYKVIVKIRNHKKNMAALSQLQSRLVNESQEIIVAMIIVAVVTLITQVPSIMLQALKEFLPPLDPWIGRIAVAPFGIPPSLNAYITVYLVKDYRKTVKEVVFKFGSRIGLGSQVGKWATVASSKPPSNVPAGGISVLNVQPGQV